MRGGSLDHHMRWIVVVSAALAARGAAQHREGLSATNGLPDVTVGPGAAGDVSTSSAAPGVIPLEPLVPGWNQWSRVASTGSGSEPVVPGGHHFESNRT